MSSLGETLCNKSDENHTCTYCTCMRVLIHCKALFIYFIFYKQLVIRGLSCWGGSVGVEVWVEVLGWKCWGGSYFTCWVEAVLPAQCIIMVCSKTRIGNTKTLYLLHVHACCESYCMCASTDQRNLKLQPPFAKNQCPHVKSHANLILEGVQV